MERGTDYMHRGLAQRSFTRSWAVPDDLVVKDVNFEDGLLLVDIERIIPEHRQRKGEPQIPKKAIRLCSIEQENTFQRQIFVD